MLNDPTAAALTRFNTDSLRRALVSAVEDGDTVKAAELRAELDRLSPPPSKTKETR